MNVNERLTNAVLDVAGQYATEDLNGFSLKAFAEHVLDELLPEVSDIEFLMALPVGSILLGNTGTDWVRMAPNTQPWLSVRGGGYGASTGDLGEITQRFVNHEGPFRLVWVP